MKYMWFGLLAVAGLMVSCGPSSSNEALDDSSYTGFFGENGLEDEIFGEETLVVEFHPTIESLESEDTSIADLAPDQKLEPVIQEEAALANQVQSALEMTPLEAELMQQDKVAVQGEVLPFSEEAESTDLGTPSNIN